MNSSCCVHLNIQTWDKAEKLHKNSHNHNQNTSTNTFKLGSSCNFIVAVDVYYLRWRKIIRKNKLEQISKRSVTVVTGSAKTPQNAALALHLSGKKTQTDYGQRLPFEVRFEMNLPI